MANAYKAVGIDNASYIQNIVDAMVAKYGAGFTNYYQTTNYLIFNCPSISSKVIKIYYLSTDLLQIYYGDAWTSGTTITNQVQFFKSFTPLTSCHLVLGDSFFLMPSLSSSSYQFSGVALIAKTVKGDSIVMGMTGKADSNSMPYCLCRNITTGLAITTCSFEKKFQTTGNKLLKFPILLIDVSSYMLLLQNDGSPDTIADLYISSWETSVSTLLIGTGYIVTSINLYWGSTGSPTYLKTGIMAEW